jgi:glucokinase
VANNRYLGFDVGGTKVTGILSTDEGKVLDRKEVKTKKFLGPTALIDQIKSFSKEFDDFDEISLVFPAPISYSGVALTAPNLTGWNSVNIKKRLMDKFGKYVYVDNDATAQTISVKIFDKGKKYKNFAYLVIGTGIGGGLFLNDRIYRGANGYAGEIGHMVILANGPGCGCGRRGCIEALGSGRSITRRVIENVGEFRKSSFLSNIPPNRLVTEDVFSGRRLGDPFSTLVLDEEIYYLSIAVANIINILDPEAIFVGGGVMKNDPSFIKDLEEATKHELGNYTRKVPILKVMDRTIDLAPIALAIYEKRFGKEVK